MSIWRKLSTLFRATAEEPAHQLVNANSIRIFEQEIRDAESAIGQAKQQLAVVMTEKKQLNRQIQRLTQTIKLREQQACQALDHQQEQLAEELAGLIAEDEALLTEQQQQANQLQDQERTLKKQLRSAVLAIQKYRRELALAKANRGATKAINQLQGYSTGLDSAINEMASSLESIKEHHARSADFNASLSEIEDEYSGASLDKRLKQAGIKTDKPDAQAILDRLRQQHAAEQAATQGA